MLGNNLIKFGKSIFGKQYPKASKDDIKYYSKITKSYKNRKKQFGEKFDVNKWASTWSELDDNAIKFFSNVKDGDNILEGFANTMGKTTKAVTSSGKEIQLTGNKFKDFGIKPKDSFSTFGKIAKNGLKSFGAGLAGTLANVGLNLLIGTVLDKAISAWQEYSNAQENAISKSQEAFSAMQENQNKIKNAQDVLDSIKENTVFDSSGNEITRFEQLSRGVNSLGENVSLTKSEFEEYNSILNSMSSAGLTATTSMAGLEAQVKEIRKSANTDSLKGLNDWVDGFNAKNNQMYTDSTKEVGLQQKLSALNKVYADPTLSGDKIEEVSGMGFWEKLGNTFASGQMAMAAGQTASAEAREALLDSADKIRDDMVASETDIKALKKIAKDYNIDIFDDSGEIDYDKYSFSEVQQQFADVREQLETEMESMVRESSGFLQAMFENSPEFDKISDSAANAISSIFNNIDYDTIEKHMLDSNGNLSRKRMEDWVDNISTHAKNKGVQEKLSNLFNLGTDTGNKSFKEYEGEVNNLLDGITKSLPGISKSLLKDSSGVSDILKDASSAYERVKETVGEDFANKLSIDNLDLAAEIISTKDVKNAQELRDAMLMAKQAAFDMNANPIFDSIEEADKTENAGDDYVKATQYLKEAKEMYDKGLYGTDDFKKRAKYLSPTGSEDPANFIENYGKAARYLTEDGSGVSNFLNDLNKKGYATFENLSDGTKKWSYNIQDLQKAAQDMGMGFEFFMDMFGRLEDYGFSNNFITSQEDGIEKITDKTAKLAQAKKELAEMETTGQYTTVDENGNEQKTAANQTAIDAKKAEIAGLENDLNELQNSLDQYNQATADSINQQIEKSKQMYTSLKEERDKILAENRYGENTDEVVKGLDEQLKQIAQDGFFEIDGEMNIVNEDEVKSELESESVELPVDINASFDDLKDKAEASLRDVQEIVNANAVPVRLDLESDNAANIDSQIAAIVTSMSKLKNEDGTIDIHAEGAEEAISVLMALVARKQEVAQPVVMSVDTGKLDGDLAAVIGKLQEFQTAYNELERLNTLKAAGVNVDTSDAQTKLNNITSEIQNLDGKQAEIMATLNVDPTSIETIKSTISNIGTSDLANVGVTVEAKTEGKTDVDALSSAIDKVQGKKVSVAASVSGTSSVQALSSAISGLKSKTITVTTKRVEEKVSKSSGTMLSPAHANGTAYNTLNTIPAHADGKVSLPKDEKALVNEVGIESIVRDGVWQLLPGGAHFEQLKKGDIVFNASQTEQLLKHGSISGHGKSYADGSVGNVRDLIRSPLSAYAGGFGGGVLGAGGSGSQANFGGNSSNKGNNGNKATNTAKKVAKETQKAADSAKDFEETLDHIVTLIDRLERTISNLERTAGNTYETLETRTDALRKQMVETTKEISIQEQAYQRYLEEANAVGLSEEYAEKVRNGLIDLETITDETLNDSIKKYQEYYEKALDARDVVEELKESVQSLYEQAFNNIADEFDNILSQIDHRRNILEGYIEQTESQGYIVSTKYYSELIKNEQNNLTELTKKRNELIASLNDAVANGNIKMYSESWYKMQQEINDVNEAIQDANTSIIEYGNSIRDLKWEVFDKLQEKISGITQESDFLIDLMSNDKLFDDKGNITEQGKATMGLHGVNYNTYMAQADQYKKEMDALQEEINKDPYNQDLIDRRKELLELQQESILAAEDEKQAIKDLVEDGINKQLDSLQELIDKYLEALDSQKDMYDYQKEIAEKQKEIASLEKQLAAYAGDDSEEGAANRQDLQNQLDEAKADLEETQFERTIQETEKLLNELYDEYEQILNMRLDNIDMLIADVIANVNSESSGIRDTITTEAGNVGYQLTESMNTIWGANGTIANILTTYSSNFSSTMTTVQQAINDIRNYIRDAVNASDNKADVNIDQSNKDQSQQTTPPAPTPTPPPADKPSTGTGDGVPKIGDAVTYVSGKYYYSSSGTSPSGNQMLGQTVYIGHINNASWAKKPYAIYRDKALKQGLGWVSLDQIKGYKTGTDSVKKDGMYWTNEDGYETILRKSDGALLSPLNQGDKVFNHSASENLYHMANNPADYIAQHSKETLSTIPSKSFGNVNQDMQVNVNIGIEKVLDYNDFVRQLQKDPKFEKLVQSMTIEPMLGKGSLAKRRINF